MTVTSPFPHHACKAVLIFEKTKKRKSGPRIKFSAQIGRDVTKVGKNWISAHTKTVWTAPTHLEICSGKNLDMNKIRRTRMCLMFSS